MIRIPLNDAVYMDFIHVPAGEFWMGNYDDVSTTSDSPRHRVRITKPFYIAKYVVTQEQWQAVMGNNPSYFNNKSDSALRPVEQVSWNDICDSKNCFLEVINKLLRDKLPAGYGVYLPTESQWEYACRSGSITAFCFGDDASKLGEFAWYDANSGGETHAVYNLYDAEFGSIEEKKPNARGIYGMHGNVWEWCNDTFDSQAYHKRIATMTERYNARVSRSKLRSKAFVLGLCDSWNFFNASSSYRRGVVNGHVVNTMRDASFDDVREAGSKVYHSPIEMFSEVNVDGAYEYNGDKYITYMSMEEKRAYKPVIRCARNDCFEANFFNYNNEFQQLIEPDYADFYTADPPKIALLKKMDVVYTTEGLFAAPRKRGRPRKVKNEIRTNDEQQS